MPVPFSAASKAFRSEPVVIRIDDLRVERFDGIGGLVRRHGVGQIHGDECDVDVLERAHFGDVFSVAGDVHAQAAVGDDVAVAASLIVIELPGRAALQVVHGDGFDGPGAEGLGLAVVQNGGRHRLRHSLGPMITVDRSSLWRWWAGTR